MKLAVAFVVLVAGVIAVPHDLSETESVQVSDIGVQDERLLDLIFERVLRRLSIRIQEAGLDPYRVEERGFSLSATDNTAFDFWFRDFEFAGLSNIAINTLKYNLFTRKLDFDISLPNLSFSLGSATAALRIQWRNYDAELSGRLALIQLRLSGSLDVANDGNFDNVRTSVDAVQSDLNLRVWRLDFSEALNALLRDRLLDLINN